MRTLVYCGTNMCSDFIELINSGEYDMCYGFEAHPTLYNRAKKIWGEPDFIHPVHDRRSYIEIDKDNDVLIFANKERPEILSRYRREYTDMKKKGGNEWN